MNRSHLDIILAPLLIVAILVSTWLFAIEPLSKTERAIESQRVVVGAANAALAAKVGVLSKQNDSINTLREQLADLRTVFPPQENLTVFISTVGAVADATGITVVSITPEAPVAYVPTAAKTTGTGAAASSAPLVTANFYTVRVTITIAAASKDELGGFIDGMQHNNRLFLVNMVSTVSVAAGSATTTISGYLFVAQPKTTG